MSNEEKTQIEEHVGLTQPDAFEQIPSGESVTGKRVFADGGEGQEKEATLLSPHAGASSDAPAASGIPSAKTQHGIRDATAEQDVTPLAGRVQSTRSNQEA